MKRTAGFSLLSALMLFIGLGFVIVVAARVVPLYLEYQGVAKSMENVAAAGATEPSEIRRLLERGFSVSDVKTLKPEDVDVAHQAQGLLLTADYDAVAPLAGNVGLVLHFHKEVAVTSAPQS
jgi:hypothetical protein